MQFNKHLRNKVIWFRISTQRFKLPLKLSEQLSALKSEFKSQNAVIKHARGWEEYIPLLLMLVTDGLEEAEEGELK